jgi:glycogen operon protein
VPELASRLTGSSDIFAASGRRTYASVNFVTCHDGFTLSDVVGFDHKHNEANGEDNKDGTDQNFSRNWGEEGETKAVRVQGLRERAKRNMLATLFFSQGVRMILGGDEIGRSQQGNNNAYCQDNEISWFDWDLDEASRDLFDFTRSLVEIFNTNPILRRRDFFSGRAPKANGLRDVTWICADGTEMVEKDWSDPELRTLGVMLLGSATDEVDERGRAVYGETLFMMLNGGSRSRLYTLPKLDSPGIWEELLNTSRRVGTRLVRQTTLNLTSHSLVLLRYNEHIRG